MSVEVELVGGLFDGRVLALSKPTDQLVMPMPVGSPSFVPGEPVWPGFMRAVYHRCVISDATHRWRYVLGSHDACRTWLVTP